jgi:hypothetical protein
MKYIFGGMGALFLIGVGASEELINVIRCGFFCIANLLIFILIDIKDEKTR